MTSRAMKLWALIVCAALAVYVAINIAAWLQYRSKYRQAFNAYATSRTNAQWPIDSYDFITRGIPCGASEKAVDNVMRDAYKESALAVSPTTHKSWKTYTIVYLPRYRPPWGGAEQPIVMETFIVRFDSDGGAYQIERWLMISGDSSRSGTTVWDLCKKVEIAE